MAIGLENKGSGGYLQWKNIEYLKEDDIWQVNGKNLNPIATYRIAITDFLLTGLEKDLDFLTPDNPDISEIYKADKEDESDLRGDIRRAIIAYLEAGK